MAISQLARLRRHALDHALAQLTEFKTKLAPLLGHFGPRALGYFGDDMRTSVNQKITSEAIDAVQTGIAATEEHITKAMQTLPETATSVNAIRANLEQAHHTQEMAYRSVVEKQEARQTQSAERAKVEKQHNALLFKSKQLEDLNSAIERHHEARAQLLGVLSEDRDRHFQIRQAIAGMLNSHLLPNIRIRIEQSADQEDYRILLEMRQWRLQKLSGSFHGAKVHGDLADSAVEQIENEGRHTKDVECTISIPKDLMVRISRFHILMVLTNLIKNGIESHAISPNEMKRGGVQISAELVRSELVVTVSDQGRGISPSDLAQ